MTNDDIADYLKLYSQLLDLHGLDDFRAKSYANASFRIDKLGLDLMPLSVAEMEKVDGIGKSLAQKIDAIKTTETFPELSKLMEKTPEGVVQMLRVKGIGPKKVGQLWRELGLESIGELLYACNENRLVALKGFGEKTQTAIIDSIGFIEANSGKYHFAKVEKAAMELLEHFREFEMVDRAEFTGELRRKCEILEEAEFLVETLQSNAFELHVAKQFGLETFQYEETGSYHFTYNQWLPCRVYFCEKADFERQWLATTGNLAHLSQIGFKRDVLVESETKFYENAGIPFIIPELREGLQETENAKAGKYTDLIETADLKGVLHNHSKYSDGMHSLEEMAVYAKEQGYQYLGMADHSLTAAYAGGLSIERVQEQHREIDQLNQRLAPFKVFKGIESDILGDGSLDYPDEVLSTFDFVVASVHQNLTMTEDKAMPRLLKAIENPYTTILGHPTGRLLLSRPGYPIDHRKIIDACAANGVAIELNAHPYRLDVDWRWLWYCMEKAVPVSINPDAHRKEGYHDMYYGVCAARKGGLTKEYTLNAVGREGISKYFGGKRG